MGILIISFYVKIQKDYLKPDPLVNHEIKGGACWALYNCIDNSVLI